MSWLVVRRRRAAAQEPPEYVVIGGMGCSTVGYTDFCQELRRRTGRPVQFIGSTRVRRTKAYRDHDYPRALIWQINYVVARLQRHGGHKVVLMGHSMGALVALLVATLHPELVKRVIILCPPGVHVDGLWLALRMLGKVSLDFCHLFWHPDHRRQWILWKSAPGFLAYILTNPVRTVAEGWHASFYLAFKLLYPQVRANDIKAPVFYGGKDLLFREKRVAKALADLGVEEVYLMEGIGHDVQFQPVETVDILVASGQL